MRRQRLCHPVGLVALAMLVGLPCGCPQPPGPSPESEAATPQGVPIVRVLVASGPSVSLATTGAYRILADGREVEESPKALPDCPVTCQGFAWQVGPRVFQARGVTVEGAGRSSVRVGSRLYRGDVAFTCPDGDVLAVNHVDVESYLAGVLARELYDRWDLRTYEAQAIAARTYALYERATLGKGRLYDLRDDQSSQVYGGLSAETDKCWQAVLNTRGIVLAAGPEGQERIFRAHFSSACGGRTNSVYVLYGPPVTTGPLAGGVLCTDCRDATRYRWPTATISKSDICRALARRYPQAETLGTVQTVQVVEEIARRPVWVDVVGDSGEKLRIRAEDLRLCLLRDGRGRDLFSMNCTIVDAGRDVAFVNGRGFGHGVGLCQWGAEGMARRGCTVPEILLTYYPGAKLFKAY